MRFQDADTIEIKQASVAATLNNVEMRLILETIGEGEALSCALALVGSQIMRPAELSYLSWLHSFTIDIDKNRITKMQHPTYKSKSLIMRSNKTKITYMMLKKQMFSNWASEQLLKYRAKYGDCLNGLVFPWRSAGCVTKQWQRFRLMNCHKLPFLLDRTNETLKGADKTQYRITAYSFRRFAFTFHYWVTFNKDIVSLCNFAGHKHIETTWEYIYPKEAIGLTQEMIDKRITWDQFVFGFDLRQMKLKDWQHEQAMLYAQLPIAQGQRKLDDYLKQPTKLSREYETLRFE